MGLDFLAETQDAAHIFTLPAAAAIHVDLVVYAADGGETRKPMTRLGDLWRCTAHAAIGQYYGFVIHHADGTKSPVLLDPYARAFGRVNGRLMAQICAEILPYAGLRPSHDRPVIYEASVYGLTAVCPDVPPAARGRFAGVAHPAVIAHLQALGVNTLQLMPVAEWLDEPFLAARGLRNVWGYNPAAFFAPAERYGSAAEFQAMVAALHEAGIAVILDIVLGHTAELDAIVGPTLNFRAMDNQYWYRQADGRDANWSGCGNTLNSDSPLVADFMLDVLRYWHGVLGADGFRFDLAAIIDRTPGLIARIAADPALAGCRLIAEPWDLGPDGYRVGRFPAPYAEWNDRFRDDMRRFALFGAGLSQVATRLCGSADLYAASGRGPSASINFIAAHDGFTLADCVSYDSRQNWPNGENNADGHHGEICLIVPAHERLPVQRLMLALLLLARGTPLLAMGCENGRSQAGNNNGWNQDGPGFVLDWPGETPELKDWIARLTALRRRIPELSADSWLTGHDDVAWFEPNGRPMTPDSWPHAVSLRMALTTAQGRLDILIHGGADPLVFSLPDGAADIVLDSADPMRKGPAGAVCRLSAHSLVVLESQAVDRALLGAADAIGLVSHYVDGLGMTRYTPPAALDRLIAALSGQAVPTTTIADQQPAPLPHALIGQPRRWGVTCQLYSLKSARNGGLGDFRDLLTLVEKAGAAGAAMVGINPLHARSLSKPADPSPYAPSSRLFLDPVSIAPDWLLEAADAPDAFVPPRPSGTYIDYAAMLDLRRSALLALFDVFRRRHVKGARGRALSEFAESGGARLADYAAFEDQRGRQPPGFHIWLQFVAAEQLAAVEQAGRAAGLSLGLYRDLAVGAAADGADAVLFAGLAADGITIGAPPDAFNRAGQNWQVPLWHPGRLAAADFEPFAALIAANLGQGGAMRLDHALALRRLFVIPPGGTGADGAYLPQDFSALTGILCRIAAEKNGLIVAEDLGAVPPGFRASLHALNIFTLAVLPFMRGDDGRYFHPSGWAWPTIACAASHDLPPLAGFWTDQDLDDRAARGLFPDATAEADERRHRAGERHHLRALMQDMGVQPADETVDSLIDATHAVIAGSGSALALVQMDDLTAETLPVNLPGTATEYPNWRRRLSRDLNDPAIDMALNRTADIMAQAGRS